MGKRNERAREREKLRTSATEESAKEETSAIRREHKINLLDVTEQFKCITFLFVIYSTLFLLLLLSILFYASITYCTLIIGFQHRWKVVDIGVLVDHLVCGLEQRKLLFQVVVFQQFVHFFCGQNTLR